MKIILSALLLILSLSLFSDILSYDKVLKNLKGTKHLEKGETEEAEMQFEENAVENPKDGRLHYNLGNAQVKSGKLEDAENSYNLALRDKDLKNKSDVFQNLGNVKFEQKDYPNAIVNYRNALVEDPQNIDARYNYELAARFLQKQQNQQQQQNQDQDQDKDKEKKEQEKQQQSKDQEKKEDKQEQQKKEEQKSDEQKKQEQQQMKEQEKKDQEKKDAEQMLKALLEKEKEEMKKEKAKLNVDKAKKGKFW
jgi:Ca-activated chloride channel homolog